MRYVIALTTAILSAGLSYITLDKDITDRLRILRRSGEAVSGSDKRSASEAVLEDSERPAYEAEPGDSKRLAKKTKAVLTVVCFVLSFAAAMRILAKLSDGINICKMLSALVGLFGVACIDYREHRIPNIFPLALALIGIFSLAAGYMTDQQGAVSYIISSVFATVVTVLCLTGASVLTNHGIGFGDIKTIGALAIIGGVYTIYGTLLFGVLLCSALSVFFFLTKKKGLKESLPFGPFILAGYLITVIISKY